MEETFNSSSVSSGSSVSEEDFQGCRTPAKSQFKRRALKNTMTPSLTTTWDLSCRQANCILRRCSLMLGTCCLGDIFLCLQVVHCRRRKNRETEAKCIEEASRSQDSSVQAI